MRTRPSASFADERPGGVRAGRAGVQRRRAASPTTFRSRSDESGHADRVEISRRGERIACHARRLSQGELKLAPIHSLALLERKARALGLEKPSAHWALPEGFPVLRARGRRTSRRFGPLLTPAVRRAIHGPTASLPPRQLPRFPGALHTRANSIASGSASPAAWRRQPSRHMLPPGAGSHRRWPPPPGATGLARSPSR